MESKQTLSIIIPTWNTALITKKCIDTIQKYTISDFVQIVIVDNGSTDDTSEVIGKLKNITYIQNTSNLGFAKGNNVGAKKAVGEYLFFLNSDMELIDQQLLNMVKYLQKNPQIGIIGPRFLNPDLTPQGSVIPDQTPLNAFNEYWLNHVGSYTKITPNTTNPLEVPNISGGAVLISRKDFDKIGGWDERYFFYYEDLELCRQVRKLNKSVYYFPEFKVIHRHGASGTSVANTQNQWRRLIPSSILYHGKFRHNLINTIIWSSQKFHKIFS